MNSSTDGKTALKKDVFDGALYFTEGRTTFFAFDFPLRPEAEREEEREEEDDTFPEEDTSEAVLFVPETEAI